jgi:hypothetical protein
MRRGAAALAVASVLLSGCASGGAPMSTPSSGRPPFRTVSPTPSASAPAEVPSARWSAIIADLARRGVSTDDVGVVSATSVTWNNGALGCPQPGASYTQALVDGMKVVVTAGGKTWDYRFGNGDTPKLCEGVKK